MARYDVSTTEGGHFKQTHLFTVEKLEEATVLLKQDNYLSPMRRDDLRPTHRNRLATNLDDKARACNIRDMEKYLKQLKPPGLKPIIKQVEK